MTAECDGRTFCQLQLLFPSNAVSGKISTDGRTRRRKTTFFALASIFAYERQTSPASHIVIAYLRWVLKRVQYSSTCFRERVREPSLIDGASASLQTAPLHLTAQGNRYLRYSDSQWGRRSSYPSSLLLLVYFISLPLRW